MLVLSHGDADGVCSVAILFQHFGSSRIPVVFTSPAALKDALCRNMVKRKLDELYIFDLSGSRETVRIASAWQKVLWIDHHSWKLEDNFENVKIILRQSPSAASLVAEYFKTGKELAEIANEIDTNSVNSEKAEFLRSLIGAIKWKLSSVPKQLNAKLKEIAKELAFHGIENLHGNESYALLIQDFKNFLEISLKDVLEKIRITEINGLKLAIYESPKFLPIYAITEKLSRHPEAPFDVIAILSHRAVENNILTKLELRTQTGYNVLELAKMLNGGGHKVAAGATLAELFTGEKFLNFFKEFQEKYSIT